MVATQAPGEMKAVLHVLRNIVGEGEGSDLEKMFKFKRIKALYTLMDIPDSKLDRVHFLDANKVPVSLGMGAITELHMLSTGCQDDIDRGVTSESYETMTKDESFPMVKKKVTCASCIDDWIGSLQDVTYGAALAQMVNGDIDPDKDGLSAVTCFGEH